MKSFFGLSYFWDIFLPLSVASVPAALFAVMGLLMAPFARQDANIPGWILALMGVIQLLGITAMAVIAFVRMAMGTAELERLFPQGPAQWRRACLFLGVVCLTLFDVLVNVTAAFAGAGFLMWGAVPFFMTYLLLVRASLWGADRDDALPDSRPS